MPPVRQKKNHPVDTWAVTIHIGHTTNAFSKVISHHLTTLQPTNLIRAPNHFTLLEGHGGEKANQPLYNTC